jgi:hypothetical protein
MDRPIVWLSECSRRSAGGLETRGSREEPRGTVTAQQRGQGQRVSLDRRLVWRGRVGEETREGRERGGGRISASQSAAATVSEQQRSGSRERALGQPKESKRTLEIVERSSRVLVCVFGGGSKSEQRREHVCSTDGLRWSVQTQRISIQACRATTRGESEESAVCWCWTGRCQGRRDIHVPSSTPRPIPSIHPRPWPASTGAPGSRPGSVGNEPGRLGEEAKRDCANANAKATAGLWAQDLEKGVALIGEQRGEVQIRISSLSFRFWSGSRVAPGFHVEQRIVDFLHHKHIFCGSPGRSTEGFRF